VHRVLFTIGPLTVYSYGFTLAVAFLVGVWISGRRAASFGLTRAAVHDSAVPVLLAGLAGAKLLYFAVEWGNASRDFGDLFTAIRGGFVFYGGVIGGVLGALWWLKRRALPVSAYADTTAPALAISLAVGRLGCWFNGCCYGKPVSWGWAVPELGDGTPRHPVQLYEAGGALAIGLALMAVPAPKRRASLFALFLVAYAIMRFGLEFLRDDPRGPAIAGMSVSQAASVLGLLAGLVIVLAGSRSGRKGGVS